MSKITAGSSEEQQMKEMVVRGVPPQDIADHFEVAVSTVHGRKQQWASEGLQFPSVRGKRKGSVMINQPQPQGQQTRQRQPVVQTTHHVHSGAQAQPMQSQGSFSAHNRNSPINITVNGVTMHIDPSAKDVSIKPDGISVQF